MMILANTFKHYYIHVIKYFFVQFEVIFALLHKFVSCWESPSVRFC